MICKKKKSKYIYVFLLSLILVCGLLQSSALSCNSYASSNSITVGDYLSSQDFYDTCAWYFRKIGSIPDGVGGGSTFTYNAFADYLESQDKGYLLQEPVTVIDPETNNASGGRGYDLPQEARQEIINYVNENVIEADPLSYVACYIQSYNFLDPTSISTYNMYVSLKNYIKQQKGKWVLVAPRFADANGVATEVIIYTIDLNQDVGLVGTVTEGSFTSVTAYINWQYIGTNLQVYRMTSDGSIIGPTTFTTGYNFSNGNSVRATSPYKWTIFSPNDKNELVYVFNTLNAYKSFNSGMPQPYYLLSDPNYIAPYSDPITYQDAERAGNYYNSIVNNVNAGDTPEETQKTVKNGLLGNLLDTLTGSNSSTALDVGNFDTSFLGTIKDLVLGVTGAIDPAEQLVNTDLRRFVTDIFGWLPGEIVTFWIAGILFSVLFGVLKIIRG